MEPKRCKHPACGAWTFRSDGYCSDSCSGTPIVTAAHLRGMGVITPPSVTSATRRKRVRRSDGYIAANGAWIATAEAGYAELQADCRDLDRKVRAHKARAERSIARALAGKAERVKREKVARVTPDTGRRITAADLAPIGDQNH